MARRRGCREVLVTERGVLCLIEAVIVRRQIWGRIVRYMLYLENMEIWAKGRWW